MTNIDQPVSIESELPCPQAKCLEQFITDLRATCQQPEIIRVVPGNPGVFIIVLIQAKNGVGAVERAEERNFEVANIRRIDEIGTPPSSRMLYSAVTRLSPRSKE